MKVLISVDIEGISGIANVEEEGNAVEGGGGAGSFPRPEVADGAMLEILAAVRGPGEPTGLEVHTPLREPGGE